MALNVLARQGGIEPPADCLESKGYFIAAERFIPEFVPVESIPGVVFVTTGVFFCSGFTLGR